MTDEGSGYVKKDYPREVFATGRVEPREPRNWKHMNSQFSSLEEIPMLLAAFQSGGH